jgi:TRAP-type C4-dicarboxylate transport system substrate-binding protein
MGKASMNHTLRGAASRLATLIAALGLAAGNAAAQTKWDLSTVWPDGNFHTQNAKRFAEEVKAATKGAVEITVKAGGQLGFKGPEHMRAVRDGLVPMADILLSQQVGDAPFLGIEVIPFLMNDDEERKILHKHVRPEIERIMDANKQMVLYIVPWPTQYLHMKAKADNLEGLKGTKVRVPDREVFTMIGNLGLSPVLIPWGEVVPALASGAVAGVTTSASSGVDGKFWEFLKYFYRTNHGASSQAVTVSKAAWAKLSPDNQKIVMDTAKRLEPTFWGVSAKNDGDSAARLQKEGMELVKVSPAMLAEMRSKTKTMIDDFIKKAPAAGPLLEAFFKDVKR